MVEANDGERVPLLGSVAPLGNSGGRPPPRLEILDASQRGTQPVLVRPLLPGNSTVLSGASDHVPPIYYVIIGRGPAAVVNHSTLVQGALCDTRLGSLPLLHIGFANPWGGYMEHGMGQPKHLLSLPGLAAQPTAGPEVDGGLKSRHFAVCIDNEFERLVTLGNVGRRGPVSVKPAWVAWIQAPATLTEPPEPLFANEFLGPDLRNRLLDLCRSPHANFAQRPQQPYRLIVFNPVTKTIEAVYADYIDVCTGPGRPIVPPLRGELPLYAQARTPPWLSPEIWLDAGMGELAERRILNGVDAIRDEVPWADNERICVSAGGGVGLNAAEKARNLDGKLDWFARTSLRPTFDNPRNKTFLWHTAEGRVMRASDPLETVAADANLLPTAWNLRYGVGATVDAADPLPTTTLQVSVTLAGNAATIREFAGAPLTLANGRWPVSPQYTEETGQSESKIYDRVVVPAGQAGNALGQAHYLVNAFDMAPLEVDGRMAVLQSRDGRVRAMGAAAQTYPGFALVPGSRQGTRGDTLHERMWDYRDELPVSAVPDGFILSGLNIASANKFFSNHPSTNVNTMSRSEIINLLRTRVEARVARVMGNAIIAARNASNGYADLNDLRAKAGERFIPDLFAYGY